MNDKYSGLIAQIQNDFCFLVDGFAFEEGEVRKVGDTTSVQYKHANMIIHFSVRGEEWQGLTWPALTGNQWQQIELDDVLMYLIQPPIDFVADQAHLGLSQSEALSKLAQQIAPLMPQILALFGPKRWHSAWPEIQAVLEDRRSKRSGQFLQWQRGNKTG